MTKPIALECIHDGSSWTVHSTDPDLSVTTSARQRSTAVRHAQREVAIRLGTAPVELSFATTIRAPTGVQQALVQAENQQTEGRQAMAKILRGLLDQGWALTDVAELTSRSNAWIRKFLATEERHDRRSN